MAKKKMETMETISVFGLIELAAAEHLLKKYPTEIMKIPLEHFPSRELCPDVWKNSSGQVAEFGLRLPRRVLQEFNRVVANLRA
jgi:hypothetical protein